MFRIALALGSTPGSIVSLSVATRAARLCVQGQADLLVVSGKWSIFERRVFLKTEAASMFQAARVAGMTGRILPEENSRDTLSNLTETKKLLALHGINTGQIIIVVLANNKRRTLFLARKIFGCRFQITVVPVKVRAPGNPVGRFAGELLAHLFTRVSLWGVQEEDIRAIQSRMELWHPGYRVSSRVPVPIKLE